MDTTPAPTTTQGHDQGAGPYGSGAAPVPGLHLLLSRAGQGDTAAFAGLYDRTAPLLHALAVRQSRDQEAAHARLLQMYAGIWRNAPRYEDHGSSALAWILHQARSPSSAPA